MDERFSRLRIKAEHARYLYRLGKVSKTDALEMMLPFIEAYERRSTEVAKKYKQRPHRFNFSAFVR